MQPNITARGQELAKILHRTGTSRHVNASVPTFSPHSAHMASNHVLFGNVRLHSVRPHSARPHSFGHAGVGPIKAQSGMLCSVCPCSRAQFATRSVHALCSEAFGRIVFGRIETVRIRPATSGTTSGQQHLMQEVKRPWKQAQKD